MASCTDPGVTIKFSRSGVSDWLSFFNKDGSESYYRHDLYNVLNNFMN